MAMRSDRATALGMNKISDLSRLVDGVRFVDTDFLTRPGRLDATLRRYGLQKNGEPVSFDVTDKDKIFQTLIDGQVEVAEVFTTDGQIADSACACWRTTSSSDLPAGAAGPQGGAGGFSGAAGRARQAGRDHHQRGNARDERLVEVYGQTFQTGAQNFLIEGVDPGGRGDAGGRGGAQPRRRLHGPGHASGRAARAVRKTFADRDIQVPREARPLDAIVEGRTRLAVAGANEFFTWLKTSPFWWSTTRSRPSASTYNMAHVVKFGNYVGSLTDLKRIGVGPAGGTSQQAAEMVLAGVELFRPPGAGAGR